MSDVYPQQATTFSARCGECDHEIQFPVDPDGLVRIGPGQHCPKCKTGIEPCVYGATFSSGLDTAPADKADLNERILEAAAELKAAVDRPSVFVDPSRPLGMPVTGDA